MSTFTLKGLKQIFLSEIGRSESHIDKKTEISDKQGEDRGRKLKNKLGAQEN